MQIPQGWILDRSVAGLAIAVVFGVLLAASMSDPNPLDDPDLASQRAGIVDVVGPRSPAAPVTTEVPRVGRRAVVFFVRAEQESPVLAALQDSQGMSLQQAADVAIVLSGTAQSPPKAAPAGLQVQVREDAMGGLAASYEMRRPRDGGAPVGYAIAGSDGTVRYRTEDPYVADNLTEVRTMLDAVS